MGNVFIPIKCVPLKTKNWQCLIGEKLSYKYSNLIIELSIIGSTIYVIFRQKRFKVGYTFSLQYFL